jgi:hypothetical protein
MADRRWTGRLARGSMPWPEVSAPHLPACRGALTVEADIPAGARLRITAWPRTVLIPRLLS